MKVVLKKKRHLDVEEHVSLFYHCHLKVDFVFIYTEYQVFNTITSAISFTQ